MATSISKQNGSVNSSSSASKPTITIRRATLLDSRAMGLLAAKTYYDTELTQFVSPYRGTYPTHYRRHFIQGVTRRMLNPRNVSFVAVSPVRQTDGRTKEQVVAYAQFVRLGTDAGAATQIASQGLLWRVLLWLLSSLFERYCALLKWVVGGDKSADLRAVQAFYGWCEEDDVKYWRGRVERENRWHAQSVVVDERFQRLGIGQRLMREVVERAEREGVPVGVESSAPGENLYRKVGFELLGWFSGDGNQFDLGKGGVMMYKPKAWRKAEAESVEI